MKEFLIAKQEQQYKTDLEKTRYAGVKGLPASLKAMYDKIVSRQIDITDVDTDIPGLILELRAQEKKVVKFFETTQDVKKETFLE